MNQQSYAQLNRSILQGNSGGKILWQPRIGEWYDARQFNGDPLPYGYEGLSLIELYRKLGVSARTYSYMDCIERKEDPRVHRKLTWISPLLYEECIQTPVGSLTQIIRKNDSNFGEYPQKWLVTTEDDLKVDQWLLEHTTWAFNTEMYEGIFKQWGNLSISSSTVPHISIQRLTLDTMGLEGTIYALCDYPETVKKNIQAAKECEDRLLETLCASPLEIINFGGHGDSRLLSPAMLEEFLMEPCQQWNDRLRGCGKFTYSHWDGAVNALLPYVKDLGFTAIEAITPVPQGDVTIEEMKQALGEHTILVDGVSALLFEPTFTREALEEQVQKLIELFAPRLILGISDEMPFNGELDRITFVQQLVDDYNSSF